MVRSYAANSKPCNKPKERIATVEIVAIVAAIAQTPKGKDLDLGKLSKVGDAS